MIVREQDVLREIQELCSERHTMRGIAASLNLQEIKPLASNPESQLRYRP